MVGIRDKDGNLLPGYFYCNKQSCILREAACVARQKNTEYRGPPSVGLVLPGRYDYRCKNCDQGMVIRAKIREMKMEKKKVSSKKFKVCNDPKCRHGSTPQPVANFSRHYRTDDGLLQYCKECMSRRISKKRVENGLVIDMSARVDVYEALKEEADKCLRSIDMQALWVLQEHFRMERSM